jgi:hypothetical protein
MLKISQGPPDEMAVWIACGIAAYLITFPIIVFGAVVCAELMRRRESAEVNAERTPGASPAPGPAHQRGLVAPAGSPSVSGVGTAA